MEPHRCKNDLHDLRGPNDYYWSAGRKCCRECKKASVNRYHARLKREWEARQ